MFASLSRARTPSKRKVLRIVMVLCVALGVWELLAVAASRMLVVSLPLEHPDAIVVLSGSTDFRERVQHAAELYHRGVSTRIILTNDNEQGSWSNTLERNPFFYEYSVDELHKSGVPDSVIKVLPQPVSSTHDEALLLSSFGKQNDIHTMLLITSDYHSRRALWSFERVMKSSGIKLGITPVLNGSMSHGTWWLHLRGWRAIPLEYVKLLYYRIYY